MQRFLSQITPFLFLGIAIVAFAFGIMLLAYLFFFGAIIGLGLFLVTLIRAKLFGPKVPAKPIKKRSGRVIDSDDWKKL